MLYTFMGLQFLVEPGYDPGLGDVLVASCLDDDRRTGVGRDAEEAIGNLIVRYATVTNLDED